MPLRKREKRCNLNYRRVQGHIIQHGLTVTEKNIPEKKVFHFKGYTSVGYLGEWKNGKYGQGTEYSTNGLILNTGFWENDKFLGATQRQQVSQAQQMQHKRPARQRPTNAISEYQEDNEEQPRQQVSESNNSSSVKDFVEFSNQLTKEIRSMQPGY